MKRRLDPKARFGLRLTLFAIALLLVAIPFALLMDQVLRDGPLTDYDRAWADRLHSNVLQLPALLTVMRVVSFIGRPAFSAVLVAAAVFVLWRAGRRRLIRFLLITTIGGGIVDSLVKIAVGRERPTFDEPLAHAYGNSFPSGHAMSSVFVYGALLLTLSPMLRRRHRAKAMAATVVLILAIGFSRLVLGVHYVSDIVGGYVLGAAWLAGCVAAFSIWREEIGRPAVHPVEGVEPEAAVDLQH